MDRKRAFGARLLTALLVAGVAPVASANVFSDAWECAKGSAQAGYALAGKGGKALQVLGQAPQCVAYATAGDVPLYATTGALFALNAIDSSVVSSSNCVASVQQHAVVPMGKLLNNSFGGVIPQNLLDAGSQEATEQLWEFMATTPPVNAAIDRVECGCTFLEAGISVQNLVEIFTIIAESGEKCDAALDNVPGYQSVKKGVQAGASAMNNLGEDIFTDQVQHKDVEAYYFQDFDGGANSWMAESHAAARVLDPAHDWRSQEGALFLSDTVVKGSGGAATGAQKKQACVTYFDNHKMSNDNANEVCESMVQRFDADYRTLVARMSKQDAMFKALQPKLAARAAKARAECDTTFPLEQGASVVSGGLYNFGMTAGAHNHCVVAMANAAGILDWHNPYAAVGSLGTPIDPATIDAQLAQGKTYYFRAPVEMSGARKIAWNAFDNSGGDPNAAVAQGVTAYELMHDKILAESKASYAKALQLEKQQQLTLVKNAAGFAFNNCPTGAKYQPCLDALGDAVQVCLFQMGSVPLSGEFPKPAEQAKIDAIQQQCNAGYVSLSVALGKRNSEEVGLRNSLSATCPGNAAGLKASCLADVASAIESCQGGVPRMSAGWFISKTLAQDPTPQVGCSTASALFKGKWAADDEQIARINGGMSEALKACIAKVPNSGPCQQQVGDLSDSCRLNLQHSANLLLGNLSLQSSELGAAKGKLASEADACLAQMMAIPEKLGAGKEAEALMLSQYGNRCLRNPACKQLLSDTLAQCQSQAGASKSAQQVVADCGDELEAALVKFGDPGNPAAPVASTGGRPPPRATVPANTLQVDPRLLQQRPTTLNRLPPPPAPAPVPERASAATGTMVTLQPNMDRMGGDYRGFTLRSADPQLCRQACTDDSACRAYTYVVPGLKGPQAMCFLKNSVPPATPDNCCTSGAKLPVGRRE
jgi:hypothetical protein